MEDRSKNIIRSLKYLNVRYKDYFIVTLENRMYFSSLLLFKEHAQHIKQSM